MSVLVIGSPEADPSGAIAASGGKRMTGATELGGSSELWVSDHATFLVLAHEGDAKAKWQAILETLKRHEAGLSVSSVLVCAGVAELGASAVALADEMRHRLNDICERFGDLPVFVLFTEAKTLPGFGAFFAGLDPAERQVAWGAPLPSTEASVLAAAFDGLADRLVEEMTDSLHGAAGNVLPIFAFPQRFAALKEPLTDFLKRLAAPGPGGRSQVIRGFYFASASEAFLKEFFDRILPLTERRSNQSSPAKVWLRRGSVAAMLLLATGLLGVWGWSFAYNRSLVAETRSAVERLDETLGQTAISEVDLENVVGVLSGLRDLPVGFEDRHQPFPLVDRLGLSQRDKIGAAGEGAYRNALERLYRSRLMLEVEGIVRDKMTSPAELYEPLKVYLMLGGQAPRVDAELVAAFLRRDWETRLYPGAANRTGREELEAHLRAMLSLAEQGAGDAYLDRQLVEAAQRSLARLDLAELAWASINSAAYSAGLSDFSVSASAGPQTGLVFDTLDGRSLATLRVPAVYTHSGFRDFFLKELGAVAQKIVDDQWVMGAGGQQVGVAEQLERLGLRLLDRYGREFAAAWNGVLDNLKLAPMTEDREKFAALAAVSSSASPLGRLVEAVAAETALTRESEAEQRLSSEQAAALEQGLRRVGIQLGGGKSQTRAGGVFGSASGQIPGAAIEAQFRPWQSLVHGEAGRRPIDALVQIFADLHQSLVLTASASGLEGRASANLQLQVHNLRANASRLPRELARMVNAAADDFESDVAEISIAQLNQTLAGSIGSLCEAVTGDAYPFARGSERDASIQDFTRLFAPGGEMDRFFAQNLASLVDMSVKPWRWRSGSSVSSKLSASTLMQFQRAAEIRDAFFPNGGSTPAVAITFAPFSLHDGADMALLDVNGQIVQSRQTGGAATEIEWPDAFATGAAGLSLLPALPGRASAIRFDGPWSLMRLMDTGSVTSGPDGLRARFVLSGRDVTYSIKINARENPFGLPALGEFRCPARL